MKSPFILEDDWGEEVILTKVTPSLLATMLKEATTRSLERYVGRKVAQVDENFTGRRACTEHICRQMATDKKLTPQGRGAFMSVLCGAVMTYSRASQSGYLVEDRCPLCGRLGDTLRHRIWECDNPEVAAARRKAAPAWLISEAARRPREQALWVGGLIPHPGDVWPRPASEPTLHVDYKGSDEPPMRDDGRPLVEGGIYVDGSCASHTISELKRAATSRIAVGVDGETKWQVRMPVPTPMPQTSQAAEYAALPLVHAYATNTESEFDVASDCLNVVRSCGEGVERAIGATRIYGGLLKPILTDPTGRRNVMVRKVPAHVRPETLRPGQGRNDAIGNQRADDAAKSAVQLHPAAPPAMQQELDAMLKRSKLVVRTIAAVMPIFPPMPAANRMQRRPVAKEGAAIAGAGGHQWIFTAGYWRCEVCWLMTLKRELDAETVHRKCDGPKQELEAVRITQRGHKLGHVGGQMPVLFCVACGSYSARRAYGLGAVCRGSPTKAGAQALSRIKRGCQPWRTWRDGGGERPKLGEARAWSAHRGADVDGQARSTRRRRTGSETRGHKDPERMYDMTTAADDLPIDRHPHAGDDDEDMFDVFGHGGALDQTQGQSSGGVYEGIVQSLEEIVHQTCDGGIGNWDHTNNAVASGTANSTVGAREEPGGPCSASVTAATAPPVTAAAVAAVAAERVAVLQWTGDHAREAEADRGVAAYGPPSGAAAPLEGVGDKVTKRRRLDSSHNAPGRLGVRPSTDGQEVKPHDGREPTRGEARRREGTDAPAALSTAARGGDAAAVQGRREQPQRGWSHLDPRARQPECSESQERMDGGGGDAPQRRRNIGGGSSDAVPEAAVDVAPPAENGHATPRDDSREGAAGREGAVRPRRHEHRGEDQECHRPDHPPQPGGSRHDGDGAHAGVRAYVAERVSVVPYRPQHGEPEEGKGDGGSRRGSGSRDSPCLHRGAGSSPHRGPREHLDGKRGIEWAGNERSAPPRHDEVPHGGHRGAREVRHSATPTRSASAEPGDQATHGAMPNGDSGPRAGSASDNDGHALGGQGDEGDGRGPHAGGRTPKRRRSSGRATALPIWMHPPTWMYLPHLGCGNGGPPARARDTGEEAADEGRVHGNGGASEHGAAVTGIRGRHQAPGSDVELGGDRDQRGGRGEAARRSVGNGEDSARAGAIRGRADALGTNRRGDSAGSSRSSAIAEAARIRKAGMDRYFADIAERAARRGSTANHRGRLQPSALQRYASGSPLAPASPPLDHMEAAAEMAARRTSIVRMRRPWTPRGRPQPALHGTRGTSTRPTTRAA